MYVLLHCLSLCLFIRLSQVQAAASLYAYMIEPAILNITKFYIDTSLIIEALEHQFPSSAGYHSIYPPTPTGRDYRPLARGFASYWTDRPLFRVMTGLIPSAVWRSSFGTDRADLIGHRLDPDKLERKIPRNLSGLDMHLSMLEPLFRSRDSSGTGEANIADGGTPWVFDTPSPSHADVALFYQLDWAEKISRGEGMYDLTAGETTEDHGEGMSLVLRQNRYPGVWRWFYGMKKHIASLPISEQTRIERDQGSRVQSIVHEIAGLHLGDTPMLGTPTEPLTELDERNGLKIGARVSVAPDDTGRGHPSIGTLIALSAEEAVIDPDRSEGVSRLPIDELRVHFPRIGFVVKPV